MPAKYRVMHEHNNYMQLRSSSHLKQKTTVQHEHHLVQLKSCFITIFMRDAVAQRPFQKHEENTHATEPDYWCTFRMV